MNLDIPKLEIHAPGYIDKCGEDHGYFKSITKINELYLFIFHEDENIPHFHLIDIFNQINISIRLDIPDFYYGHINYKYNITQEQKDYIYNWMNDIHIDNFGNKITNWKELIFNWKITNSKFEEDYYDQGNTDDYNWNIPDTCPDYRLLP